MSRLVPPTALAGALTAMFAPAAPAMANTTCD
jgi:hypothetical protein